MKLTNYEFSAEVSGSNSEMQSILSAKILKRLWISLEEIASEEKIFLVLLGELIIERLTSIKYPWTKRYDTLSQIYRT